ncbi:MAG: hypothetical protein LC624_12115 [Halobacteriales archaeon]|nr:hypothetical protein [Halobacteriales archaeon]
MDANLHLARTETATATRRPTRLTKKSIVAKDGTVFAWPYVERALPAVLAPDDAARLRQAKERLRA